jgi:hypothetical protein
MLHCCQRVLEIWQMWLLPVAMDMPKAHSVCTLLDLVHIAAHRMSRSREVSCYAQRLLRLLQFLQALVEQEMSRVYGQDTIAAVVMVHDTAALDAAAAQYCTLQEQFEDVLDWYQSRLPATAAAADVEAASGQQQSGSSTYKGKKDKLKRKTVSSLC